MPKTNNDPWYERAEASARLTQGDIILGCPLIAWADRPFSLSGGKYAEVLKAVTDAVVEDVIVMTQACDLENDKVSNVVLCPH